jgi:hypothetical protein
MDDRGLILGKGKEGIFISLRHRFQTGSVAHPAPYPTGTRGSFPGDNVAEA